MLKGECGHRKDGLLRADLAKALKSRGGTETIFEGEI